MIVHHQQTHQLITRCASFSLYMLPNKHINLSLDGPLRPQRSFPNPMEIVVEVPILIEFFNLLLEVIAILRVVPMTSVETIKFNQFYFISGAHSK